MFKKLHMQMTAFCTVVTGAILLGLSVACLIISESGIKISHESVFENAISTTSSYLEKQNQISYEWLSKMQVTSETLIHIIDNGNPLMFSELYHTKDDQRLIQEMIPETNTAKESGALSYTTDSVLTQKTSFDMKVNGKVYHAVHLNIPKNTGSLTVYMIKKPDLQNGAILRQRLLFSGIDIIALLFLFLFSFYFAKRMIQPLKESQAKQSQFIASASHELRTPLTVILSSLQAMKKADKEQAEAFSNTIDSEGRRMSRLLSDMLSLAGADNHSWSIEITSTPPDTLLLNVYESFELIARKNKIQLSISLPEDEVSPIQCDMIRLEQVLSILVDNAISYTGNGGTIYLSVKETQHNVTFSVADNGPGISDEDKKHIFDRFYRAEKSHTEKNHFGLGLCIAQEIIKLHHGKLWVEDTALGGATFLFTVPK